MIKARRAYSIIFLCFLSIVGFSQNLVPNPSFETLVSCPVNNDNINNCANWMNFGNSPDYYNGCASGGMGVPNAGAGYQFARSGVGMAGIVTWYDPNALANYREFIGAQLTTTLQIGVKYYFSFFINWSGYLYGWKQYAANKIGLRLSTVASSSTNPCPLNNFAHLKTTVIYQDTVNWFKVTGSFLSDSNYKYVEIGNFFNDANTDTLSYSGAVFGAMSAYYYIDDVCVTNDSTYNAAWTGFRDFESKSIIAFFPNPVDNYLSLKNFNQFSNYKLYDIIGNEVKFEILKDKLDLSIVAPGIYFLFCTRENEVYKSKIIKK